MTPQTFPPPSNRNKGNSPTAPTFYLPSPPPKKKCHPKLLPAQTQHMRKSAHLNFFELLLLLRSPHESGGGEKKKSGNPTSAEELHFCTCTPTHVECGGGGGGGGSRFPPKNSSSSSSYKLRLKICPVVPAAQDRPFSFRFLPLTSNPESRRQKKDEMRNNRISLTESGCCKKKKARGHWTKSKSKNMLP